MINYVCGACGSSELLQKCYEIAGVRWFDSAHKYLEQGAPQALGQAIDDLNNPLDLNVITKVGMFGPWTPEQLDLEWAAITEHIPPERIKMLLMHGPAAYVVFQQWHNQGGFDWLGHMRDEYNLTIGMSGGHTFDECFMFKHILSTRDNDRKIKAIFINYGRSFCDGAVADLVAFCKDTERQLIFKKMQKLAAPDDSILEVWAHTHAANPDMVCVTPRSAKQVLRDRAILEMLDYGSPLVEEVLSYLEQPKDRVEITGK